MLIDPIAPYGSRALAGLEPVPTVSVPLSMPAVGVADQVRFEAALRPVQEPPVIAPSAPPIAAPLSESPPTPGELILRGLEHLRAHYRTVFDRIEGAATSSLLSPMELLSLQMQVAQVTLGAQLVGQVASKLEQNLNMLLKGS